MSHSVLRFRQTRILNCSAFCAQTAKHLRVFCRNHFFFLLKFRGNFHVPSFASLTQHKSPWLFLIKPLKPHCRCCAYKCPSVPRGTQSPTKRRNVRESSRRRPRLENYQLQKQKRARSVILIYCHGKFLEYCKNGHRQPSARSFPPTDSSMD